MIDPAVLAVLALLHVPGQHPDPHQVACLARAVYHEARGEAVTVQVAVAHAVLNRGHDVCRVIAERGQFPWYRAHLRITDPNAWRASAEVAALTYTGAVNTPFTFGKPQFFHEARIVPGWAKGTTYIFRLGPFVFRDGSYTASRYQLTH